MNGIRFDTLTQGFEYSLSRRLVLSRVATGLLAIAGVRLADAASVKQRKRRSKHKKKPLSFNEFGCINVGGKCRGKDELCCSGICQGKKPKQGKRDKRRCVAHDTGGCTETDRVCPSVPCTTSIGHAGGCMTTTGNAPYCADLSPPLRAARMPTVCRFADRSLPAMSAAVLPGVAALAPVFAPPKGLLRSRTGGPALHR